VRAAAGTPAGRPDGGGVMFGWLLDRFATVPAKPAMVWRDEEYSYGWLVERIAHWKAVAASRSCGPGSVVAIEGDYSPEVCALFLALADQRAVVVPLTSAVEASKPTFCAIAEVHAIFRFDPDGRWTFVRRDNERAGTLLAHLKAAAGTDANLMPHILECVEHYATLGEICGVLREVFGEYRAATVI